MFTRKITITEDGSHTFKLLECNEQYHSLYGAVEESLHVFIHNGLSHILKRFAQPKILEVGLGTGLNAFLTAIEAQDTESVCNYFALEPYPIKEEEYRLLNYPLIVADGNYDGIFRKINSIDFGLDVEISPFFIFRKEERKLEDVELPDNHFNLVYFDAFGPDTQPEMWCQEVFEKLFKAMTPAGVLVTYCAKGQVRRNMKGAGFEVEKVSGPTGKREITRATKPA
jgi:tRNA U34 5-methylaminomethyl-2-thiouridine-forming methyltransferase MnmC